MAAMTRARSNVHQIRSDLTTEFAQARQDQMTNEIMELIATS
jgi:F0F1-type ATP synthase gamma subunit